MEIVIGVLQALMNLDKPSKCLLILKRSTVAAGQNNEKTTGSLFTEQRF